MTSDWTVLARRIPSAVFSLVPVAAALAYFCAATLSLWLTQGVEGIATIWPASGILLATLLLTPDTQRIAVLAGAAVASLAANMLMGAGPMLAIGLTLANVSEGALAWWMLCGRGERIPNFIVPADIGRFGIAAVTAAAASACVASMVTGLASSTFTASWFLTDLLGMAIVSPMALTGLWSIHMRRSSPETAVRRRDVVLLLLMIAAVALIVFVQSRYPLLFLPMVVLLGATYRLGPFGAAAGVLLIAVIGASLTAMGHGPLMLLADGPEVRPLFLQFYLLVLLGTALPLGAMLAKHNLLMREVAESNRLLRLAEREAQMGHWRLETATDTLFWSPEVFRLHGVDERRMPTLEDAIQAYHPDDRDHVSRHVQAAMAGANGGVFGFDARLVRPDGAIRHVVSRGMADHAPGGQLIGLFGVIQDVTDRVTAAEALDAARKAAETAADTDQLTGIASRRAALRLLDAAIAETRDTGRTLSVAIFDIDHFKMVNDRHGHQVGDRVLQRVARAAVQASRHDDVIGRLGGEEFMLLLPGAEAEAAIAVAERVRVAIGESVATDDSDDPPVTISIGVARLDDDLSATALLNRADRALYEAKRSGRNRLRIAA